MHHVHLHPRSLPVSHTEHSVERHLLLFQLSSLSQHWEQLLFSTGGAINLKKSHWYLMAWTWKNGVPKLATIQESPGELKLTTGYNAIPDEVPRIQVTTSFRTLGVFLAAPGCQKKQFQILCQHAEHYRSQVLPSTLTPDEGFSSYMAFLWPKLGYPLPCCSLTQK